MSTGQAAIRCPAGGHIMVPVRASNRRRQRLGGKKLAVAFWRCPVCEKPPPGNEFYG